MLIGSKGPSGPFFVACISVSPAAMGQVAGGRGRAVGTVRLARAINVARGLLMGCFGVVCFILGKRLNAAALKDCRAFDGYPGGF